MDACFRSSELPAQLLGQSFDRSLGCVVGWVSRRVCDSLLASSKDNCSLFRLCGFFDHGQKHIGSVQHPEQIRLERLMSR